MNPRAELVGELHTYATLVPADWLDDLTERTIASIEAGEQEEHALICAVRLAETKELPARYRDRLAPRVRELVKQTAALDPAAWSEYGPQPLWYVSTPDSPAPPISLTPRRRTSTFSSRSRPRMEAGSPPSVGRDVSRRSGKVRARLDERADL